MIQIARILKSNGTDGEILINFRDIALEDLEIQEPVFIFSDGLPVPFFVSGLTKRGRDKALVRLIGINSLEDAEEIVGQAVYLPSECFGEETYDDLPSLEGWTLLDEQSRAVGEISGYEDIPGNPCIYVETNNGQIMIPLHEDLILSVDSDTQEITMSIPEGLL